MKPLSKILLLSVTILFLVSFAQKLNSPTKRELASLPNSQTLPNRFILMGDTGSGNENQQAVANAIQKSCGARKSCGAIFILGDVIYEQGVRDIKDPQFKTKFEDPYRNINLPFYIVLGNHDNLGCVDCYIKYSEKSTKWTMPDLYYKKDFGEIAFYIINTENFDIDQQNWLKEHLEDDKNSWKIVLGHQPLISYEETKIDEEWNGKKKLMNIVCQEADLYVSGHSHILENAGTIPGCKVKQLTSGGGGASIRTALKPYPGEFFFEGHGFLFLEAEGNKLQLVFIDKQGKILHEFELKK